MNKLIAFRDWVDARLPIMRAWNTHMGQYYAPKNFNFWYFFGVMSLLVLVNQLLTGIWLTMMYVPTADAAFASVEYIMRDVDYGWIIRYMHSTGASAFFIVVYLHMFRALLYGSYKKPRELVWVFGMLIFFALMAEAFLGYILPWGQMSYWGAQVIVSLFGAIPVVGDALIEWIRGDYLISGVTLNRFFALHVVAVPIIILALVVLHLLALHEVGSNNPDGVEIKKNKDKNGIPLDGVAFHPYYTVHDIVGVVVFLMAFCSVVFIFPEMGGYFLEYANFEQANPLKTPAHIAPVWYFTPFYSILRAVPDKLLGFIAFGSSVAILFVLPWLDRSPVKSIRYKGKFSIFALFMFSAAFLILGVLGVKAPTPERTLLAQICSIIYFAYFITMPFWSKWEKTKPEPDRVTMNGGFGIKGTLLGVFIVALLTIIPLKAVGSEAGFDCGTIPCERFEPNLKDKAILQNGAKTFINYCIGCHSMQYMRYERLATDLEIPLELASQYFIFDDSKIGDIMSSPVSAPVIKKWFGGAAPPDLTLVARARGDAWIYTYLKSFYQDAKRPYGYNNLVFKDVGMPNVFANIQGEQVCKPAFAVAANGGVKRDPISYENVEDEHHACGRAVHLEGTGTLTAEEFDETVSNLVSFLVYAAEPARLHDRTFLGIDFNKREAIGAYSLLFLAIFLVFALLLNREYWKDVH